MILVSWKACANQLEFLISIVPFCFESSISHTLCYKENKDKMAKELNKYKQILERDDKEFREAMRVEVGISWSSQSNRKM